MVERHGAVEVDKRLLVSGDMQAGLLACSAFSHVGLTVAHAVLNLRCAESFEHQDRQLAQWRLAQASVSGGPSS